MSSKTLVASLALLCGLALAAPTDTPRAYAATAPLTLAPGEALQQLSLPWPVLQASRSAGLADLRVFDARGEAVPLAWANMPAPAPDQQRRVSVPRFAWPEPPAATGTASRLHLRLDAQGTVLDIANGTQHKPATPAGEARIWLLDLSGLKAQAGEQLRRITLDWPRRNAGVSTEVEVEASSDGRQWRFVTQAQLLDLNADEQALSLKRIDWTDSSSTAATPPRYLRLRLGVPLNLSVSDVELALAGSTEPARQQAVSFEPVAASGSEPAHWLLDLQGPIAPESLALHLPEQNHLLQLRLEQRAAAGEPWRAVQRFTAWRMQRGGRESESQALDLRQAAPARFWRLVPQTADATLQARPLPADLGWRAPRLVFLARGEGLQLAIGREKASPVALPLRSLIPAYQDGAELGLPAASLGALVAQAPQPWTEQLKESANPENQRRWILWAVLVASVIGLGVLAWRMLGQINAPE